MLARSAIRAGTQLSIIKEQITRSGRGLGTQAWRPPCDLGRFALQKTTDYKTICELQIGPNALTDGELRALNRLLERWT